jgi:hypothetical protein
MEEKEAREFTRGDRVQVKRRRKTRWEPALPEATGTVGLISHHHVCEETWEVGVIFDEPISIGPFRPSTYESSGGYGIVTRRSLIKLNT